MSPFRETTKSFFERQTCKSAVPFATRFFFSTRSEFPEKRCFVSCRVMFDEPESHTAHVNGGGRSEPLLSEAIQTKEDTISADIEQLEHTS